MDSAAAKYLHEIFPEILHVVDRNASMAWRLNDCLSFYNLMLVYDGKAEFTYNTTKFTASKGDLVFYKPNDMRKAHTFHDNLLKCFAIDFLYTCPVYLNNEWKFAAAELPFVHIQKINDEHLFSRLLHLFSLLTRSALSSKNRNKVKERALFCEILTLLFNYKEGNEYSYSSVRKVDKVINYMTEHYCENITLQQLSDYAQISSSYLGSIFKKVTGKSAINYLIDIRINKAKALLRDGFSVSETSTFVGFNDIFYFSRAFKKNEGMSPSQYINSYSGES